MSSLKILTVLLTVVIFTKTNIFAESVWDNASSLSESNNKNKNLSSNYKNRIGFFGYYLFGNDFSTGKVNQIIDFFNNLLGFSPPIEHINNGQGLGGGIKVGIGQYIYLIGKGETIWKSENFKLNYYGDGKVGVNCYLFGGGIRIETPPAENDIALGIEGGFGYYSGEFYYDFNLGSYGRLSDKFKGSTPGFFFNASIDWYTTAKRDRGLSALVGYRMAKIQDITNEEGEDVYINYGMTKFDLDFSGFLYGINLFYYFE